MSDWALRRVQEENEDEENLLDQLSSLLSAIMKKYGDAAMPLVDLLMPSVAPLLAPTARPRSGGLLCACWTISLSSRPLVRDTHRA